MQAKYTQVMRDKAELTDTVERLEHIIMQLQDESNTIGKASDDHIEIVSNSFSFWFKYIYLTLILPSVLMHFSTHLLDITLLPI